MRLASFDIGKKNFAHYVELLSEKDIEILDGLREEYSSLPKKQQRRVKGPMNDEIASILHRVCMTGTRVQIGVYDLREDKESTTLDMETRRNILMHLDNYRELWINCDRIIIEQQFFRTSIYKGKGTEANVDAIKIGELVLGWFLNEFPHKEISYFGSQNKTLILGAPYNLDKSGRKKWAIVKSEEIYRARKDEDMIEIFDLKDRIFRKRLNTPKKCEEFLSSCKAISEDCRALAKRMIYDRQKLDDVFDCLVQLQAYKFRAMVAMF